MRIDRACRRKSISIHAPARGATSHFFTDIKNLYYFNSRPCARGDGADERLPGGQNHFNSRPCARGDITIFTAITRSANFNSRPCARGDGEVASVADCCIFQFTPLREGRLQKQPNIMAFLQQLAQMKEQFLSSVRAILHLQRKSAGNDSNICANLREFCGWQGPALKYQLASRLDHRRSPHSFNLVLICIAEAVKANGILLAVNDSFELLL